MSTTKFTTEAIFNVTPQQVFDAWLSSTTHSEMTRGEAQTSQKVGAAFTAWDGYISGRNIEIQSNKRIVQAWRTTEFNSNEDDSIVELQFEEIESGCKLTLNYNDIPVGQPDYKQGWEDHYCMPMRDYFIPTN